MKRGELEMGIYLTIVRDRFFVCINSLIIIDYRVQTNVDNKVYFMRFDGNFYLKS
ncbi:MAG: hypothetical protein OSJ73_07115 [Lachnospiraceae bacterium]|nr:hypothetical protein [Lachnospiraceae bacterium]